MTAVRFDAEAIDALFEHIDQSHLPGAAIGIAINGEPVYRKGFGLANLELPVVLSPTIRMRIASMSKHFTCLAYLLLCEEGRADIDDPIGKHLPELHGIARGVTAQQLMGHTSGLRDVVDIGWQFGGRGQPVSSVDLLDLYKRIDDANAPPGNTWIYNNGGYLLLSAAIERIAEQSLEEVMRQRIFGPAGMYDTMLRRWDTDFVPNSAALHMTDSKGRYVRSYLGMELTGDAGVVSTVDDMLRWLAHMDEPRVGNSATWKAMKAPQSLANGTSTAYGMGLVTDTYRGVNILYHDGGVMGGNSRMLKVPAAGLDVVVMVNRQDVNAAQLVALVLDACLPDLRPVKLAADRIMSTGTFQSLTTDRVVQLFVRDGQQIASIDGFDVPLTPDADGVLQPTAHYRMLKLTLDIPSAAEPESIRLTDFGHRDELQRIKPITRTDSQAIKGTYRCDTIRTQATIEGTTDNARLVMTSAFGSEVFGLEQLASRVWRARPQNWWPPGGILLFDEDGASSFRFFGARTRALRFGRVA